MRVALERYISELPSGHVFDLSYGQIADVFPPGEPDESTRAALRGFAQECGCNLVNYEDEQRYELIRR